MSRFVYLFDEGCADPKELLGSKGANLAEMKRIGLPVPEGFTVATTAFRHGVGEEGVLPDEVRAEIRACLHTVEQRTGAMLGDPANPLFVSVRSGASSSMPGMMDTVLNLGLNEQTLPALARRLGSESAAYQSYSRMLQMYGQSVLGVDLKRLVKVSDERTALAPEWQQRIAQLQAAIRQSATVQNPLLDDPFEQLEKAILAVYRSWHNPRAAAYRRVYGIPDSLGTAVTVQEMVFGNSGSDSGTGVLFTRDPSTGADSLVGEYLAGAQGEEVVAGHRTPEPISSLQATLPTVYLELERAAKRLEAHFRDMQDIEFTVEKGQLYLLQTRNGKRTTAAAVKIAVDLCLEGQIDRQEALSRVDRAELERLLVRQVDEAAAPKVLARGLPATPGAVTGPIALDSDSALCYREAGQPAILVRRETDPNDFPGIEASVGVLTAQGGITSHAAVVTRPLGKPCVVDCKDLVIEMETGLIRLGETLLQAGDWLTVDGTNGRVFAGTVSLLEPTPSYEMTLFRSWSETV